MCITVQNFIVWFSPLPQNAEYFFLNTVVTVLKSIQVYITLIVNILHHDLPLIRVWLVLSGCIYVFEGDNAISGLIQSPAYDKNLYPHQQSCTWSINAGDRVPITLTFGIDPYGFAVDSDTVQVMEVIAVERQ